MSFLRWRPESRFPSPLWATVFPHLGKAARTPSPACWGKWRHRASKDARRSTGYRASKDARLSTGYGRRMGCGPAPQRWPDGAIVTANLHRAMPAFRTPSGLRPPSPLRGEGELTDWGRWRHRASKDARRSTGYRASEDARLSTGYGRRMGCGPAPQRWPDCIIVTANLHRAMPAFRAPSGLRPPSPLRGEGELTDLPDRELADGIEEVQPLEVELDSNRLIGDPPCAALRVDPHPIRNAGNARLPEVLDDDAIPPLSPGQLDRRHHVCAKVLLKRDDARYAGLRIVCERSSLRPHADDDFAIPMSQEAEVLLRQLRRQDEARAWKLEFDPLLGPPQHAGHQVERRRADER